MSLSTLYLADTLFPSYSYALADLNEGHGLVLHPIFVVVLNQERATLSFPRGKNEKKKRFLLEIDG